jgi:hypothetical protein
MSNSVLVSLAFLKINWDTNRGIFLDNFIPFLTEALKDQTQDVISVSDLQTSLNNRFSLCIPQHVIKALLFRAKGKNIVILKNHVFYKNAKSKETSNFISVQQRVQIIYDGLISDFQSFAKSEYKTYFSESEAEKILLAFLSYNQLYIYQTGEEEKVIQNIPTISNENKVIISDYIVKVSQKNPLIFDYLDTIVKGFMIANALYLPDVHITNKKFRKTKIYLDTSFILFSLGYSGPEEKSPCIELINLLRINNARILCFRHTVEEIKGILGAASNKLGGVEMGTFGRSIRYFSDSGYLNLLGVGIEDKPDYSKVNYVVDEDKLFQFFKSKMPQNKDSALSRDVDSISAIYRVRRNETSSSIENSLAIFVTTNNTLNQAANDFYFQDHDRESVPPCITDFMITNFLWLKTPNQAPKLPMKRIIADSYAAIEPDNALLLKWIKEINKLKQNSSISEEDYYFMRYSKEVHTTLVEYTKGNPDIITTGSVLGIINKAKERIREDMQVKLDEETRERIKTESEYSLHIADDERKELERTNNLNANSRYITKPLMIVIKIFTLVLLAAITFISLPFDTLLSSNFTRIIQQWPGYVKTLVFFVLFIWSLYQIVFQPSFSLFDRLELFLQDAAFRLLDTLTKNQLGKKSTVSA